MDNVIHQAMWALVGSLTNTMLGWVMSAAGPVLALLLALGTCVAVWKAIFEPGILAAEQEEEDLASGSSEEARAFWDEHEDAIDLED